MHLKEIEIPVPWGCIAAKAWGSVDNPLVLMIHGFGDNAGSFDRLVPHLPELYYYVCIDFPSHGKSSLYPPHLPIHTISNIIAIKIVVDYFSREKLIVIGHSWGGQLAAVFAQLYPDCILKLVILEAVYLYPISSHYFKQFITERFDAIIKLNNKLATGVPPVYTYEEARNKMVEGRMYGKLDTPAADAILKRSLIPVGDGKFRFSTDTRLRSFVNMLYDDKFMCQVLRKYPIECPTLIIAVSESIPIVQYLKPFVKEMRRNKKCVIKRVRGNHDVHNNQPEIVAPLISEFLVKVDSKL